MSSYENAKKYLKLRKTNPMFPVNHNMFAFFRQMSVDIEKH